MVGFNSILLKLKIYTSLLFTASGELTLRMKFKPLVILQPVSLTWAP